MTIRELAAALEEFAPLALQEEYDNSGLTVGRFDRRVESALVCVDVTQSVVDEAVALGAGLIVSHHPAIFHPLKQLIGANYTQKVVESAVCQGVALYACHTNLDRAGMSFRLAELLGVEGAEVLGEDGFGAIGTLPTPVGPLDFLQHVQRALGIKALRHSELATEAVQRVALCTGSGANLIETARVRGAEIYLCADLKYNDFFAAADGLTVADIGHFESEFCAIDLICDIIWKKFPNFALHKPAHEANPVKCLV